MLRSIRLTNFKCFEQLDLDCTMINLLCGLNGMGKSSIVQALLVLRQSFETGELTNGRLVLGGERVDLGAGLDILFENAASDFIRFSLEDDNAPQEWEMGFEYSRTADQLSALPNDVEAGYDYVPPSWRKLPPFGGNLIYVNAERIGPRKLYPLSDMFARRVDFGASGEFAWSYLSHCQNDLLPDNDPRCVASERRRLRDAVDQWLQEVHPGAHLELEEITAADAILPGFAFDRAGDVATRPYRATNVGFGLSYVLPVILALLAQPNTLCMIENPEAHLHPRGQTKLAELAALAASVGVQVFVETHSDHFIDGVRIAVRDGIITPEDTAFHYFERDGSHTVVSSPQVDQDGRLSRWPAGFFDQHEENLARLIAPRA
ncbi:MAG: DUF3696 domain-containing protein [Chloroflexota bacterium]|nr:DUF3696 domain-containing protein [Chloroflexota bacterium]